MQITDELMPLALLKFTDTLLHKPSITTNHIMEQKTFIVTEYLAYRAELRKFDLPIIEHLVRYGQERYFDTETGRRIVIGEHNQHLVMVA
ncbi:hypothetical protein [Methylomonas sp. MgM2]